MFNLVDEPWIPVRTCDGLRREVSLREVYREAPELDGLALEFPLEHVAVTRMLVAVLQSALGGPSGVREKLRWLNDHDACVATIDAYLDRWRHRFDLFDPERPFMQQPVGDEFRLLPVSALRPDWASGNNVAVFDHRRDAEPVPVDPGMAARALLVALLYQPGGGVSQPFNRTDSPGTKSLMAVVDGGHLWETLVANTPSVAASDTARPTWERDQDHTPDPRGTTPLGWLDRVTWRSRAVRLIRDDDARRSVRWCRMHQHLKITDDPPFDPFVPVRRPEGEPPAIIRPSAHRAAWRDADALLRGLAGDGTSSSIVLQSVELLEQLEPPRFPAMRIVGQIVAQAKVADVRQARLPVSRALLADEERLDLVKDLIERADVGAKALRGAVKRYADAMGDGDGWTLAGRWERPIWAALAAPFSDALAVIAHADEPPASSDVIVVDWLARVRRECRGAFETFASAGGAGPRQAQALAHARDQLERGLFKITPQKKEGP